MEGNITEYPQSMSHITHNDFTTLCSVIKGTNYHHYANGHAKDTESLEDRAPNLLTMITIEWWYFLKLL